MSGFASEPVRTDEHQVATSRHGDSGKLRDRQSSSAEADEAVTMDEASELEIEELETEISAGQKMLSAVSGSLLTSLLGSCFLLPVLVVL